MRTTPSAVFPATVLMLAAPVTVAAQRASTIPDAAALRAPAHAYHEWRDIS